MMKRALLMVKENILLYTLCGFIILFTLPDDSQAATKNKNSNTYAEGAFNAGAIDVSFGSKSTVDAHNFDKGQANDVQNTCGLVNSGDGSPINSMKSALASAHDVSGRGGASGRVSTLSFLKPGTSDTETKGKFCLYKDASGGYWSIERASVGASSNANTGVTACSKNDRFSPARGCATKKASVGSTKMTATITAMQAGDRACYVDVMTGNSIKSTQLANFDICEQKKLVGKKVELTLVQGEVLARSCEGNIDCGKSDKVMLIKQASIIAAKTPYTEIAACNSGQCSADSNVGYKNCLSNLADKQDKELDRLHKKVRNALGTRDRDVSRRYRTRRDFIRSHKKWQKFRNATCDIEYAMAEGGTAGGEFTSTCLCNLSYHRNQDLKRFLSDYLE